MITITAEGGEQLAARLAALGSAAPATVAGALYREAEDVLEASKALVPVDFAILRSRGFVEPPEVGPITAVALGYEGPYALAVHENPRAGHTGGVSPSGRRYRHWAQVGEWKFLETPWKASATHLVDRIAEDLDEAISAMGHS